MGRGFSSAHFFSFQKQTFYIQHHFLLVQCTVIITVPASPFDTLEDKKQEIVRPQETVSLLQIALFFCNESVFSGGGGFDEECLLKRRIRLIS